MNDYGNDPWSALLAEAESLYAARSWTDAEEPLRKVLETAPEHTAATRLLAQCLRQLGRWEEAAALLRAQLARNPEDPSGWAELAGVRLGQGAAEAAVDAARRALALDPNAVTAQRNLALACLKAGDTAAARAALANAMERAPDDPDVLCALGLFQASQGAAEAAEASFHRVLALAPAHPEALANLAPLLVKKGETALALTRLEQALAQKPFLEGALHLRGKLLAQAGEWEQAAGCFEQLLAHNPEHDSARARLENIRKRVGAQAEARAELRQAEQRLATEPRCVEAWVARGRAWLRLGQADQAEEACEQALRLDPEAAEAKLLRARLHLAAGALDAARGMLEAIHPTAIPGSEPRALLARVHYRQGRFESAGQLLREAIARDPERPELYINLGEALRSAGRLEEARDALEAALALDETRADTRLALGNLHQAQGNTQAAIGHYEQGLKYAPRSLALRQALGLAYFKMGRLEQAEALLREALRRSPFSASLCVNLAAVLMEHKNTAEAEKLYQRAAALDTQAWQAQAGLALVYRHQFRFSDSIKAARKAQAIKPAQPTISNNLGYALLSQGRVAEAIETFDQAIGQDPNLAVAWSNKLLALNYTRPPSWQAVAAAHFAFGAQFDRAGTESLPRSGAPDVERRLRIGYMSSDLYAHSCAYFAESLFKAHDANAVEVFCYSDTRKEDDTTARLKGLVDHWIPILGMSNAALRQRVGIDALDVLVDLNGHAGDNRLPVFGERAAPVQVNWLGYANTTGLRNMDYRITDAWADPPGWTEDLHSETLVRLPGGFLCYTPDPQAPAPVAPPVTQGKPLSFGCFNNSTKVGPETAAVWAELLRAIPGSRLALKSKYLQDIGASRRLLALFAEQGIGEERLLLKRPQPDKADHLGTYNLIDIALDPFPYNGTTTTCEALWMGVPVIVLAGEVHVSRVGASLLKQVGLDELIALTPEEYVAKAVALAADHDRLTRLRLDLRARMAASTLCDPERFAREMEAAYRWMVAQRGAGERATASRGAHIG